MRTRRGMIHFMWRDDFVFYTLIIKSNSFLGSLTFVKIEIFYYKLVFVIVSNFKFFLLRE